MLKPEEKIVQNRRPAYDQPARIRVWLVEDKSDIRELLAQLISFEDDLDCERSFASAESMLNALESEPAPDVILSDYDLGAMNGAEAISHAAALAPETRVLIMTAFTDAFKETSAMAAGAAGFLLKSQPGDFAKSLRAAAALPANPATLVGARKPSQNGPGRLAPRLAGQPPAGEPETETRVVGDAIVVWVKRVFKSLGATVKADIRRSRLNIHQLPD